MWQKVAKFKRAEYFRKALYVHSYVVVVILLDYLLDIIELSELEAQAFRYICIDIC
jgi:hypothetical protein